MRKRVKIQGHEFYIYQPSKGSLSARLQEVRGGAEVVEFIELVDDRPLTLFQRAEAYHEHTGNDMDHCVALAMDGYLVQFGSLLGVQGDDRYPWDIRDLMRYVDQED